MTKPILGKMPVQPAGQKHPYQTFYFSDTAGRHVVSQGHSKTEKGAVRGATVKIFMRDHMMARIFFQGVCVYAVRADKAGIRINYGRT